MEGTHRKKYSSSYIDKSPPFHQLIRSYLISAEEELGLPSRPRPAPPGSVMEIFWIQESDGLPASYVVERIDGIERRCVQLVAVVVAVDEKTIFFFVMKNVSPFFSARAPSFNLKVKKLKPYLPAALEHTEASHGHPWSLAH